jgi:hypothetical protein
MLSAVKEDSYLAATQAFARAPTRIVAGHMLVSVRHDAAFQRSRNPI